MKMVKKLKIKRDDNLMLITPRLFEIIDKINELIDQRNKDKINRDIDLTQLRMEIAEITNRDRRNQEK